MPLSFYWDYAVLHTTKGMWSLPEYDFLEGTANATGVSEYQIPSRDCKDINVNKWALI